MARANTLVPPRITIGEVIERRIGDDLRPYRRDINSRDLLTSHFGVQFKSKGCLYRAIEQAGLVALARAGHVERVTRSTYLNNSRSYRVGIMKNSLRRVYIYMLLFPSFSPDYLGL